MDNSGPAFPVIPIATANGDVIQEGRTGLTKRELFAAMAMQGYCARKFDQGEPTEQHVAGWAVAQADALIAALSESGSQS